MQKVFFFFLHGILFPRDPASRQHSHRRLYVSIPSNTLGRRHRRLAIRVRFSVASTGPTASRILLVLSWVTCTHMLVPERVVEAHLSSLERQSVRD